MPSLRFVSAARSSWCWGGVIFVALSMFGCRQMEEMAAEAAFSGIEEIEERNARAAQARIDLVPRSDAERSEMENSALSFSNESLGRDHARIKEAFCGSPPDLAGLPPEFFKFQPSVYIPEDTPAECRAAVDRKFPNLESCYLVFENGSTGYINCYIDSNYSGVNCMPVKKLLWEVFRNEELRKDCPDNA